MPTYIIRVEKTKVLTYEKETDTIEDLDDYTKMLIAELKSQDPDASYYVEWTKSMPRNMDWMKRMPTQITDTLLSGSEVAKEMSQLEKAIIQRTHTPKLTDPQREKLGKDVFFIPATNVGDPGSYLDSPIRLYNNNTLFKQFADEKIKAMVSHSAPNGKIVNTLCAYENAQGWLWYKDLHFVPPAQEPISVYEGQKNLGYSPSIKRVNDAS